MVKGLDNWRQKFVVNDQRLNAWLDLAHKYLYVWEDDSESNYSHSQKNVKVSKIICQQLKKDQISTAY